MIKNKAIFFVCSILLCNLSMNVWAQTHTVRPTYIDSLNTIVDSTNSLKIVYEQLAGIDKSKLPTKISFVHIGDSHIQAGFNTQVIREGLQQIFGSGGRGLIAPLSFIKTNQPHDYRFTSTNLWNTSRCIKIKPNFIYGINGFDAQCADSAIQYFIGFHKKDSVSTFKSCVVFHKNSKAKPQQVEYKEQKISEYATRFIFTKPQQSCTFKDSTNTDTTHIFGISLENNTKGIVYHSIGINGAQYNNYIHLPEFQSQLSALQPKLYIISLGTNEAYGRAFSPETMYANIDTLIQQLSKTHSNVRFILTTPGEGQRIGKKKKVYINQNVELARNTIIQYAKDKNIAYWDMYAVIGGKRSSFTWKRNGLMARDGVHYSPAGYKLQGKLFYEAFIKSYTNYVESRIK